jgi:23S rRNA-/tRNA-specific pseudouridylate synthase
VELVARGPGGLAALSKPAGVLSHPNAPGEEPRSLLNASYDLDAERYDWPPYGRLWLLNRLDSATSGVILAAADEGLARGIKAQFKLRRVRKIYCALVFGAPRKAPDTWRDRLDVDRRGGRIRTGAGHIPAECRMGVLRSGRGLSLLRLEPATGRSHQLRVQCARRNLPIVGDQTYGDFGRNRDFSRSAGTKRLFLHSLETRFDYEVEGRKVEFSARAPLPPEFEAFL